MLFDRFLSFLNQTESNFLPLASQQPVLLSLQPVIIHKEILNLFQPLAREIFQLPNVGVHVVSLCHGHEPVVTNLLFSVELLAFNHPNEPSLYCAARKGRFVHQEKYIDWISVWRDCLGQETKVIGENHTCWKNLLQGEYSLIRIICELVTAPCRRFDDDLNQAFLFVSGFSFVGSASDFILNSSFADTGSH